MLSGPKVLRHYQTAGGKKPFLDWLLDIRSYKIQSIINNRLERFAEGNPGQWRSVGQGVYELKIDWGPGYRIYFGCDGVDLIILLMGGDKSTQRGDILEAHEFWGDYQRRKYGS